MYQMNPDTPRQLYAELVQTRERERLARTCGRSAAAAHRPTVWHVLSHRFLQARSLTHLAKG